MARNLHIYTEEEYANIGRGIFIEGVNKRSQQYAYERWLKRKDLGVKKFQRTKPNDFERPLFSAKEDLLIMKGEFPSSHSEKDCKTRKRYLEKNYVQVGWGSLIGTQTIHW